MAFFTFSEGIGMGVRQRGMAGAASLVLWVMLVNMGGCREGGFFCTDEAVPGITLEVRDAVTGLPATCGLEGWLISGSYSELLSYHGNCAQPDSLLSPYLRGAYERPGTYTVLLVKEGYENWSRDGTVVTDGDCHVGGKYLEARLVPGMP